MDTITFGVTVTIIGMLGTLGSLYLLTLVVKLLKHLFPYQESKENNSEAQ